MTVAIIGVGLIGGSLALALKSKGIADKIIGVEENDVHLQKAMELGLVNEMLPLENAIQSADLVVLAIPVEGVVRLLPIILDQINSQVVIDVGSTKESIATAVNNHPKRNRFVATHPMWGTENSGPDAAEKNAFINKATVICDKEKSDDDALLMIENIYTTLGMHIMYMNAKDHDLHVAYVSHIAHITSFALANTVLEKEKEENTIFELASAGFESTVRLAKSNPATWSSIFMENKDNVLDVLNEHIVQLQKFKTSLENEDNVYLEELMTNANKIKRILK